MPDLNRVNTRIVPVAFDYAEPSTRVEFFELLEKHGKHASLLAGGTDLMIKMKQRITEPHLVVNIKRLPDLAFIRDDRDYLRIGATTKLVDVELSDAVRKRAPVLIEAVSVVGSIQIRNMATLGGNLCNASPAADGSLALLALGATVELQTIKGSRKVSLDDFFLGPGKTVVTPGELLTQINIPHLRPGNGAAFSRITRVDMDLAKVNVAVKLGLSHGVVSESRIALGAVAPVPMRAVEAEASLAGKRPSDDAVQRSARLAAEEIKPINDVRSTAEYRRDVAEVLVRRCLYLARERAGGTRNA